METSSYIRVDTADSAKPKKKEVLCLILGTGRAHPRSTAIDFVILSFGICLQCFAKDTQSF